MKKKHSSSGIVFSKVQLNKDSILSFISDLKVVDKISKEDRIAASMPRPKPIASEQKPTKLIDDHSQLNKDSFSENVPSKSSDSQIDTSVPQKTKEELIDIVEVLDSCGKARRAVGITASARVHCFFDGNYITFWFTHRLYSPRELSPLNCYGRFVHQYSDTAIRIQKSEVGIPFSYDTYSKFVKGYINHQVILENKSDLQDHTIDIAGHEITYQYRDLREFLEALRLNMEDIRDVESRIKYLEEHKGDKKTPYERGQATSSINKLKEKYRILTQQQEDLKNITIYIRKQGEMRYSHIVDPIQTDIMSKHLFDGKTVIIKGGPGTGKTTTMIHRLSYLTDAFAIKEDEKDKLGKYKLTPSQRKQLLEAKKNKRDWMFFSPSQMLKEYLADAMKKEELSNTSEKVWCWKDYCRMILHDYYHLLDEKDDSAPFKIFYSEEALFYQGYDIVNVFTNFYLDLLRKIKEDLPPLNTEGKIYEWTSIAQNIQNRLDDIDNYDLAHFVSLFNSLESVYGNDCRRLLRDRNNNLSELAERICKLLEENHVAKSEIQEIFELTSEELMEQNTEEDEISDDDENNESGILKGKIQKLFNPLFGNKPKEFELSSEIQKWLKAYCYSKVNEAKELTEDQKIIADILLPIIGDNYDKEINKIGELMRFEQYAQYTRGVRNIMLNGIPARYKKFRTYLNKTKFEGCNQKLLRDIMQSKQGKELHLQEQSLLLGFINTLVKNIKASSNTKVRHDYIDAYEEVSRPIIGIDEATDFSICEIYAMQSLLSREFNSLTICGDIMQRMTSYGIKSWKELDGVLTNPEPFEIKTSYRQSRKLLEVAKQICVDELKEEPKYRAYMTSNKVPAPLVYVEENEFSKIEWISKRISEVYRAYGENLPSIAIFVTDKGYIPRFINYLLGTEFFKEKKIKILDGTNASKIAESHICVYPINVVKGMEFDVVFFHNVDKTDAEMDNVKRYIYVGLSRAAFFLGVTMEEENVEISRYFAKNKDWFKI